MTDYRFMFNKQTKQWRNMLNQDKPLDQSQLPDYCKIEDRKIKCETLVNNINIVDNNLSIQTPNDGLHWDNAIFGYNVDFASNIDGYSNLQGSTGNRQFIRFDGFERKCEIIFDNILPAVIVICNELPQSLETVLNASKRIGMLE